MFFFVCWKQRQIEDFLRDALVIRRSTVLFGVRSWGTLENRNKQSIDKLENRSTTNPKEEVDSTGSPDTPVSRAQKHLGSSTHHDLSATVPRPWRRLRSRSRQHGAEEAACPGRDARLGRWGCPRVEAWDHVTPRVPFLTKPLMITDRSSRF